MHKRRGRQRFARRDSFLVVRIVPGKIGLNSRDAGHSAAEESSTCGATVEIAGAGSRLVDASGRESNCIGRLNIVCWCNSSRAKS